MTEDIHELTRQGKNPCPKCGKPLEMYYAPWCPRCDKPQEKTLKYLNLIQCLRYIEAQGNKGYYDRMWDTILYDHMQGNDSYMFLDFDEDVWEPEAWADVKLLRDTFDLGTSAHFYVSW